MTDRLSVWGNESAPVGVAPLVYSAFSKWLKLPLSRSVYLGR